MKNKLTIIILVLTFFTITIKAQIAIGKDVVEGGGIMDFAFGTTKGIILPVVETLPTTLIDGTILMDKNDLKIKMGVDGNWIELSDAGSISGVDFNSTEDVGKGVVIGDINSATINGVLVLEATDKALILPKVADPHLNVKSPYPGMICYDTASKTLALFDGIKWNYWK